MPRRNHYGESFSRGKFTVGKAEKELKEIGEHVFAAAAQALKQGADSIVADAKTRCPVDTGKLKNSIKAEPQNKRGTVYKITANAQSKGGFYYGQIVEFSPKINKPFLYPAFDAKRDGVVNGIAEAIREAVERGK